MSTPEGKELGTRKQTWGMYSNNGVKNKSAQVIMIPVTIPEIPDLAPLS